jgi:hypothetical protein
MDNLNKYLPVGQANAVEATIMTTSGNTMTGTAWLEDEASTEANVQAHTGIDNNLWVIAGLQIVAIAKPEPPADQTAAQPASGGSP